MTSQPDPNPGADFDRRMMAAALRIGRRNLGRTSPNPAVGAIIVRADGSGGIVVGRGWTAVGGRPHAETVALDDARGDAKGATAYVTLEPCAHEGHTPPCARALIDAGVARVVTTMTDPDPRVAGKGLAMLRSAGIEVSNGVLEADAAIAHGGHIMRVTRGRPWITLKLAISADGMIGRRDGERMMITGKPTFDWVQSLRSEYDAVMIGLGTVQVDDPRLTIRLSGADLGTPIRIVVDTDAKIPLGSNLVTSAGDVPFWLMVGDNAPDDRVAALESAGVVVERVGTGSGGVDLNDVFAKLAEGGLTRILVEGGSQLAASLVSLGLVDEVLFFRAPVVVGSDGVRALAGQALSAIERSPRYRLADDAVIGEDRLRRYLRVR
jgi:diaminohydroxyphosphoribosylaminopyrimidine deaminase/5-amino-6-(5-phosphoribosylamino)uracil reductase